MKEKEVFMNRFKRVFTSKMIVTGLVVVLALVLIGAASFLKAEKSAEKEDNGKGYIGVMTQKVTPEDKQEFGVTFGVLVTKVMKGEAAEKAGIKKYDVIQYFNDEKIRGSEDLMEAVRSVKPGSNVKVKLFRDSKEKELTVTPGVLEEKELKFEKGGDNADTYGRFFKMGGGGYLGVNLHEMNKNLAEYFGVKENEGALILSVEEDSPAQEAGLKSGDVIVKIEGKNVLKPKDATKILSKFEKGDKVDVDIIRHNKKMTVKVELEARNAPNFQDLQFLNKFGDGGIEFPFGESQGSGFQFRMPDNGNHKRIFEDNNNSDI
jgi:C-terminal processing protease CtpA/Prc